MAPQTNYFDLLICITIPNDSGKHPQCFLGNTIVETPQMLESDYFEQVGKDAERKRLKFRARIRENLEYGINIFETT